MSRRGTGTGDSRPAADPANARASSLPTSALSSSRSVGRGGAALAHEFVEAAALRRSRFCRCSPRRARSRRRPADGRPADSAVLARARRHGRDRRDRGFGAPQLPVSPTCSRPTHDRVGIRSRHGRRRRSGMGAAGRSCPARLAVALLLTAGLRCRSARHASAAVTQPPCDGPGGVAFYAGPALPLQEHGDGWYESNPTYAVPAGDQTEWTSATPASAGVDGAKLERGIERLAAHSRNLQSVLVARGGRLIEERYFHGASAAGAENINSASKSVMQALLSIAVRGGAIGSLQEPVARYAAGTVHRACGGRARNHDRGHAGQCSRVCAGTRNAPSTRCRRAATGCTACSRRASRRSPAADASTTAPATSTCSRRCSARRSACRLASSPSSSCSVRSASTRLTWAVDPTSGVDMGGCDLYMTPRALARFAQLYLDGGVAGGRRLLDASAMQRSSAADAQRRRRLLLRLGLVVADDRRRADVDGLGMERPVRLRDPVAAARAGDDGGAREDGDGPFREINSGRFIAKWLLPAVAGSGASRRRERP